jgi:hypothetical protein
VVCRFNRAHHGTVAYHVFNHRQSAPVRRAPGSWLGEMAEKQGISTSTSTSTSTRAHEQNLLDALCSCSVLLQRWRHMLAHACADFNVQYSYDTATVSRRPSRERCMQYERGDYLRRSLKHDVCVLFCGSFWHFPSPLSYKHVCAQGSNHQDKAASLQ